MAALRKILSSRKSPFTTEVAPAPAPEILCRDWRRRSGAPRRGPRLPDGALKNIVLFFAAPFLGLAYIVALPFVGLGFLAFMAARAAAKIEAVKTIGVALKTVAMLIAAPFIGLAYVVFFPFIGLAMLAWMGGRAVVGAGARRMR